MNADLKIGDSILLLSDEFPAGKVFSPQSLGGSNATIHTFVKNFDARFNQALSAGATVVKTVMDMFCGDRYGQLAVPFVRGWAMATHIEALSSEEFEKQGQAMMAEMAKRQKHT